jgi:lipoprotein-releasing system permease protein
LLKGKTSLLYEVKLAFRFLFVRPKGFYRVARFFTISTIAISVGALLLSLSAFNGYLKVISQRYLDSTSHITVSDMYGRRMDTKSDVAKILSDKIADAKYSGYLELLVSSEKTIRGLGFEVLEKGTFDKVLNVQKYMQEGAANCIFESNSGVIIGSSAASVLGLSVGSNVNVLYSGSDLNRGQKVLKVCGIVDFGLYDLDSRFAYISSQTGAYLFPEANFETILRVKLISGKYLDKSMEELHKGLYPGANIKSWKDIHYGIFESVKFDRMVIFFILSVLVAVSVFNVIASLILLVKEMKPEISILQVLGLNMKRLMRVFFFQSLFLGLSGFFLGLLIWSFSVVLVQKWGIVVIPKEIYLVSHIPMYIRVFDIFHVLMIVILFVSLASILPLIHLFKRFNSEGVSYGFRGQSAE